jgi:hypothetical protein
VLAAAAVLGAVAGCSSEDVTGEPEDIRTLVEVVRESSECAHDPDTDEVALRVLVRNDGEDDRTVRLTPMLSEADGDETERSLDSAGVAVPGDGREEARLVLDSAPDDLSGCAVRLDGGEPVPVTLRRAVG